MRCLCLILALLILPVGVAQAKMFRGGHAVSVKAAVAKKPEPSRHKPKPKPKPKPVKPPVTPPPPATPPPVTPPPATGWWQPGTTAMLLSWQLGGRVTTVDPKHPAVYDIDGEAATAADVTALHAAGAKVICYLSAGTYENWRHDASTFPAAALGSSNGWPGEKWLDIRNAAVLAVMQARVADCVAKGFDAVEFDNVDGYANSTGFPLTAANQLAFNQSLAGLAHSAGLSAGLKNDLDQAAALQPSFDWALDEECYTYSECGALANFTAAGKAVWIAEYKSISAANCANAIANHWNAATYDLELGIGAAWTPCT